MEGTVTPLHQLWKEWSLLNKTKKNIKNLQNFEKRPWVYARESEAFLDYLNCELDNSRNEQKFNLNYLLSIYNDCKMQII